MPAVLWLNFGLGAVFFGTLVGTSLWLVLKHPDRPPVFRAASVPAQRPAPTSLDRRLVQSGDSAGRRAA